MRKGLNPNKDIINDNFDFDHQVIIPVFIPSHGDYFLDTLKILEISLKSIIGTVHSRTFISVVSNGSSKKTESFLNALYENGSIHELIFTENIGKLNSIYKALGGHNIPLVTIADADVLFVSGWQEETFKLFSNFPKTGTVGLIPQFLSYQSHCHNLLFDFLFSKKLKFGKVEDPKGLKHFYNSLGWKDDYPRSRLKYILYLEENRIKAIVGSGHVVATYRRELFNTVKFFNPYKMGGNSELTLDELAGKFGLYRFTTVKNYAYHLGNKIDKDEIEEFHTKISTIDKDVVYPISLNRISKKNKFVYTSKKIIIQFILKSYKLRMLFLNYLGLPKDVRKTF